MNNSKPYSLNKADFYKGLVVAAAVAFLAGIQQMLTTQELNFAAWDLGLILNMVLVAVGGYLSKQFVTDSNGVPFGKASK